MCMVLICCGVQTRIHCLHLSLLNIHATGYATHAAQASHAPMLPMTPMSPRLPHYYFNYAFYFLRYPCCVCCPCRRSWWLHQQICGPPWRVSLRPHHSHSPTSMLMPSSSISPFSCTFPWQCLSNQNRINRVSAWHFSASMISLVLPSMPLWPDHLSVWPKYYL